MSIHIVKRGEHLSRIADDYGFRDYRALWDLPENTPLRAQRNNPHTLVSGDRVFVPERGVEEFGRATGQRHRFVVHTAPLKLLVRFECRFADPVEAGTTIDGDVNMTGFPPHRGFVATTGADGLIEVDPLSPRAYSGSLGTENIDAPSRLAMNPCMQEPHERYVLRLSISLQDVLSEHGQICRLNNLGYQAGDPDAVGGAPSAQAERQLRSALEEFQCDHGLPVTGDWDSQTRVKLLERHGC